MICVIELHQNINGMQQFELCLTPKKEVVGKLGHDIDVRNCLQCRCPTVAVAVADADAEAPYPCARTTDLMSELI